MAEPGDDVAFIHDGPFDVHVVLLSRLSLKWIIRMRAVCKVWCSKLDYWASLRHRLEPPRPLICFDRVACPDRYAQLRDYCVKSLDLRSGKLRSVFRFTDNVGYEFDAYDLEGRPAPAIHEFRRVDYTRMENYCQIIENEKQPVLVHASLDGHLLVSSVRGWHVVNPATREWVALPDQLSFVDVVGFYYYAHVPCGEYRVLCFYAKESPAAYYGVLTVSTEQLRVIGRPISPDAAADHGLAFRVDITYSSPPIQFRYNRRLHWSPQRRQGYHILVFDTGREEFSWKRPPPVSVKDQDMRLLEFPDGHLGLSVSRMNEPTLELWRLQDYRNVVWVRMYRIQLALQQMPVLQDEVAWLPGVVSEEGDVLIQSSRHWLLHCDRNGNLLRQFWFPERLFAVRHMLRESLVRHPMFRAPMIDGAIEPPFFHGLCSE